MKINLVKSNKSFGGQTLFYEHDSKVTKTKMNFSAYVPGKENATNAIIWLSGLTCNEENFITKSGVQNLLKDSSTMVICPDTSPRGLDLPDEHTSYAFGSGAGFYLNATTEGYKDHYKMYDYIRDEIVNILKNNFQIENISIMGHSMGGHGALVLGLREPDMFCCVSAFSPVVNPTNCPWGQNVFKKYFGEDYNEVAKKYDATLIVENMNEVRNLILIDQGLDDEFLEEQLLTKNFEDMCSAKKQEVQINYREGYDHSYYFISTFLESHIKFHIGVMT